MDGAFALLIRGGQGWGRTADLPLFRRLGESNGVHRRPPEQAIRHAGSLEVQDHPQISIAVVSKALARSAYDKAVLDAPGAGSLVAQLGRAS
jgi:hypothetical protein